jgi:hypothetical protein
VVVVHTGIKDRHDSSGVTGREVPSFGGVNVGIGCAATLPGIVQTILLAEVRVVRGCGSPQDSVRLDERKSIELAERGLDRLRGQSHGCLDEKAVLISEELAERGAEIEFVERRLQLTRFGRSREMRVVADELPSSSKVGAGRFRPTSHSPAMASMVCPCQSTLTMSAASNWRCSSCSRTAAVARESVAVVRAE